MRRLLVLRPEPGASATVERARQRGLDATATPLFEVEAVDWRAPTASAFDGLLLTSANAVRHGGDELQKLRGLEVYAVGEATAEAARERGFGIAAAGEQGVDELLASIEPELRLLHICGQERREPHNARQQITSLPVYRARQLGSPDLSNAQGSVALIHSPRAGRRFAELVGERSSIALAAISAAAAEAADEGWESVSIAERPNEDALLALAASLCNKPQPK
jgi:uroporphyrinogen-III synthase